jgi:hypothetical protein
MTLRTSRREVTFHRPFALKGVDETLPAGTYVIESDEELLEELSFTAYQRIATTLRVPIGSGGNSYQMIRIDPADLKAAEERDREDYSRFRSDPVLPGQTEASGEL